MDKFNELIAELIADLKSELDGEPTFKESVLAAKVRNSVREAWEIRKIGYPSYYDDEKVVDDISGLYSKIRGRALYYYNQIGAEGQESHNENGTSVKFSSIDKLYPIQPFTKII